MAGVGAVEGVLWLEWGACVSEGVGACSSEGGWECVEGVGAVEGVPWLAWGACVSEGVGACSCEGGCACVAGLVLEGNAWGVGDSIEGAQ